MPALYILIPVAIGLVGFAIWLFFWAVDSGQYDDLDSPAHSILFDDEDPKHKAGIAEAGGEKDDQDAPRG
ncbi:cbb3-type cytochrome oxidase assembly protein CcoS [Pseudomonas boanensis]|uniref:Cbb3-type cytochrome oxidase assembly protein CcoS n=1 Tax=Metapseudomonas boanensis TaxID=2822138 RepID=A0ABS5XL39_9GAMM|nr:cbb3-type cytochrome oxidase assembly protein CcoS [Pseudomonas boanensis]MBT8768406.1 cbb3-type cytochrome oxidase assembly protein CcoS [Pseudomonas boanensis]